MIKQIVKAKLSPLEFEELQNNHVSCSLYAGGYKTLVYFGMYKDNLLILEDGGKNYIARSVLNNIDAETVLNDYLDLYDEFTDVNYYYVPLKQKMEEMYDLSINEVLEHETMEVLKWKY